jgi:hypothetical protein
MYIDMILLPVFNYNLLCLKFPSSETFVLSGEHGLRLLMGNVMRIFGVKKGTETGR